MKKLILSLAIAMSSSSAYSLSGTTKKGSFAACHKEEQIKQFVSFAIAKDYDSMEAYLKAGICFPTLAGKRVTILKSPGIFGTTIQFAYLGQIYWTTNTAIDIKY